MEDELQGGKTDLIGCRWSGEGSNSKYLMIGPWVLPIRTDITNKQ